MNYYCYIAGLQEPQIDNPKSVPSMKELTDQLMGLLSVSDRKLLDIFRLEYDNANLLNLLANKEAEIDSLGILGREDWTQLFDIIDESDELNPPHDKRLRPYHLTFYQYIKSIDEQQTSVEPISKENYLASLYYDFGLKVNNQFVKQWFEYNLNVNNILSALISRKHGWNITQAVVGNNNIANAIRKSSTVRDFNIRTEIDYLDQVIAIADVPDLLEREHRIDLLKWQWLDENTKFEYFSIEKILSYYIRCQIIHRWDTLTVEQGTAIFRQLIDSLKNNALKH